MLMSGFWWLRLRIHIQIFFLTIWVKCAYLGGTPCRKVQRESVAGIMRTHRSLIAAVAGHSVLAALSIAIIGLSFSLEADASVSSWTQRSRVTLDPMMRLRGGSSGVKMTRSASQQDMSKPDVSRPGPSTKDSKKEKIWQLSKAYKPVDKESIQRWDFSCRLVSQA